jgi:hypothetical protein
MYVYGKMRSIETIPGIGKWELKENDGGDEFNYGILICCKNFCKCRNVPLPSTIIKNK